MSRTYYPRHAMARAVRSLSVKARAAIVAAPAAVAGGLAAAGTAGAAPAPLKVTLYANGDSTAVWSDTQTDPVLTAGHDHGTSAQVDVVNPPAAAPATAPSFSPSTYGGGDPRWVIELRNGCYLFGYPNEPNTAAAGHEWSANPGGPQGTDYATALAWAQSCGIDDQVNAAFIVDDAGFPGTAVHLSGVQYNGQTLPAPLGIGYIKGYGSRCLDDFHSSTANGTKADLYYCNNTSAQRWVMDPDGTMRLPAISKTICLDDTAFGGQGEPVEMYQCNGGSNQRWSYNGSELVPASHPSDCLNDPGYSTTAGVQQILWACVGTANEQYTKPSGM